MNELYNGIVREPERKLIIPCENCGFKSICKYSFPSLKTDHLPSNFRVTLTCLEQEKLGKLENLSQ